MKYFAIVAPFLVLMALVGVTIVRILRLFEGTSVEICEGCLRAKHDARCAYCERFSH